jgi:hypothetical protein
VASSAASRPEGVAEHGGMLHRVAAAVTEQGAMQEAADEQEPDDGQPAHDHGGDHATGPQPACVDNAIEVIAV